MPAFMPTSGQSGDAGLARGEWSLDGASLSGARVARWPVLWGAVAAAVWLITVLVGRRWRRWPAYALGVAPLLVALFQFFEHVNHLLPANY